MITHFVFSKDFTGKPLIDEFDPELLPHVLLALVMSVARGAGARSALENTSSHNIDLVFDVVHLLVVGPAQVDGLVLSRRVVQLDSVEKNINVCLLVGQFCANELDHVSFAVFHPLDAAVCSIAPCAVAILAAVIAGVRAVLLEDGVELFEGEIGVLDNGGQLPGVDGRLLLGAVE